MKVLYIIDRIEFKYFEFNQLVTDFWIIKELYNRNHGVFVTTPDFLFLKNELVYSKIYKVNSLNGDILYDNLNPCVSNLDEFDIIMFRPDPPVDTDYIAATYLLDFVKKAKVINSVSAIRNFNEKLHAVLFSKLLPEYLVTANRDEISEFLKLHKEIILKPLNKCFGAGVMYLKYGDYNTRNILNLATNDGKSIIMVQKYLPSVKEGDKRVLILGEQVLKYGVRKIPTSDDFKFNTHSDDYVKGELLSNAEIELFKPIAKELNSMGIYMAGLDVVGDKVIEINVTSPCYFIKEINNAFNVRLDEKICDFIESIA